MRSGRRNKTGNPFHSPLFHLKPHLFTVILQQTVIQNVDPKGLYVITPLICNHYGGKEAERTKSYEEENSDHERGLNRVAKSNARF